mmetsp:Transcript_14070/g.37782  ORF Transcript_14070/g.37782 Transcript_14070/m.37782 type:complete len:205 (-) Transcript_14070:153-767(-)
MGEPVVWHLDLVAVLIDLLEKHAVLVANAIAPARVVASGERVHKAGCEAAETSVAKTRVALYLTDVFELVSQSEKRLFKVAFDAHIHERILEVATHEKLKREVVHALDVTLGEVLLSVVPRLEQTIAHRECRRLVRAVSVKVVARARQRVLDVVHDLTLDGLGLARQVLRHKRRKQLVALLANRDGILRGRVSCPGVSLLRLRH